MSSFSVIEYEDRFQPAFKALNLEWLEQFNLLEERDLITLNDPRKAIMEEGGIIYLAIEGEKVIGSAAVMYEHGEYELAKMAVDKAHRGKGISKVLLEKCIAYVRACGGSKVMLYSNSQLATALALYRSYGFREVVLENSPFETADIKMELTLMT